LIFTDIKSISINIILIVTNINSESIKYNFIVINIKIKSKTINVDFIIFILKFINIDLSLHFDNLKRREDKMKTSDWMPTSRAARLNMAKNWCVVINEHLELWRVPPDLYTRLCDAVAVAATENAVPTGERNKVSNSRLRMAFREMMSAMRDIKKRCFYVPPLTNANLLSLGLKPRDTTPTPVKDPVGLVSPSVIYVSQGVLELRFSHASSIPFDELANYGYRVYYGVYAHNDTPPKYGYDLRESRFTRRKKMRFVFELEDSTKMAYFSVRYENSKGKAGAWGQMVSAVIP
jgi:hypothetical protein